MLEGRHKVTHPSYTHMQQLDFQILLIDIYYTNPNSIHICFPIEIKEKTNENSNIDDDLVTENNFFLTFCKRNQRYKVW